MPFYGGYPRKGKKNLSFRAKILHFFGVANVRGVAGPAAPGNHARRSEINNPPLGAPFTGLIRGSFY